MTDIIYNKKERAFFLACAYLGALFASTIILWWTALVGGNPLTFESSQIVDSHGNAIVDVRPRQAIGIQRLVCSSKTIGIEFFPSLTGEDGLVYPLQSGVFSMGEGCDTKTYGFIVPDLPPGEYTYQGVIRYQTSLVGRDEMVTSPAVRVRISP